MKVTYRTCDVCGVRIPKSNIFTIADFQYIRNTDEKFVGEQAVYELCLPCAEKIVRFVRTEKLINDARGI